MVKGAEWAEIFAEDRSSLSASFDDGHVEEVANGRERGAGIRVVAGETSGYAHTDDLSEQGLLRAAAVAAGAARAGVQAPPSGVSLSAGESHNPSAVEILPESVPRERKVELLLAADEAARSGRPAIKQVSAGYGESRREILVASTSGVFVSDEHVRTRFSVNCVASGDGGLQTGYETTARTVGFEHFGGVEVEGLAAKAASRAVTKLSARPAPSGELAVVLASGGGGVLFHEACGHGLEADHIAKDVSVYVGKIGAQVASPLVTLVDDGTQAGEWGSYGIDDEGNPGVRSVLIEGGVLQDYMWDRLRAGKEGRDVSGNGRRQSYRYMPMVRMTNTFILPGESDPDEIVAQTPHGVYVAQLGGGQVNTTTGDFVFGMTEAYLIEGGRITAPLRDANLIGNGPQVLSLIDAVASDFGMQAGTCGKDGQSVPVGVGQPTLRIASVTVGGTADG